MLYRRVQDVLDQPNHYEKILSPTILKDAHLFCKETTNQPQPQGLNPNQQAKVTAKPCKPIQRLPKPIPSLNRPGFVVLHFAGRSHVDVFESCLTLVLFGRDFFHDQFISSMFMIKDIPDLKSENCLFIIDDVSTSEVKRIFCFPQKMVPTIFFIYKFGRFFVAKARLVVVVCDEFTPELVEFKGMSTC